MISCVVRLLLLFLKKKKKTKDNIATFEYLLYVRHCIFNLLLEKNYEIDTIYHVVEL